MSAQATASQRASTITTTSGRPTALFASDTVCSDYPRTLNGSLAALLSLGVLGTGSMTLSNTAVYSNGSMFINTWGSVSMSNSPMTYGGPNGISGSTSFSGAGPGVPSTTTAIDAGMSSLTQ